MRIVLRTVFNVGSHSILQVLGELGEKRRCVSACLATGPA